MRPAYIVPLFVCLCACAAPGGDDGGSANLPGRGLGGWEALGEGPLLPLDGEALEVGGPAVLVSGDEVHVWYHQKDGETFAIHRVIAPRNDGTAPLDFGAPARVSVEGRDPSVIPDPADPTRLLMAYATPDGLRLARGDGLVFEELALTLPEGVSPSLVDHDGRLSLYAIMDGALTVSRETSALDSQGGEADPASLSFAAPVPVLTAGSECVDLAGEAEACWDGDIVDAEVRLATTPTGRQLWRVFYAARPGATGSTSLGFAASDDGLVFSRYAFNPVLDGVNVTAPATARIGSVYHLLVEVRSGPGRSHVGQFVSTPDAPSDTF